MPATWTALLAVDARLRGALARQAVAHGYPGSIAAVARGRTRASAGDDADMGAWRFPRVEPAVARRGGFRGARFRAVRTGRAPSSTWRPPSSATPSRGCACRPAHNDIGRADLAAPCCGATTTHGFGRPRREARCAPCCRWCTWISPCPSSRISTRSPRPRRNADAAYHDFLLGHARWFASVDGSTPLVAGTTLLWMTEARVLTTCRTQRVPKVVAYQGVPRQGAETPLATAWPCAARRPCRSGPQSGRIRGT